MFLPFELLELLLELDDTVDTLVTTCSTLEVTELLLPDEELELEDTTLVLECELEVDPPEVVDPPELDEVLTLVVTVCPEPPVVWELELTVTVWFPPPVTVLLVEVTCGPEAAVLLVVAPATLPAGALGAPGTGASEGGAGLAGGLLATTLGG